MAMIAVAAGQYLTPAAGTFRANAFAMAAAFFVCGFGNIINDIGDIEADRINHPQRALPSGIISVDRARTLAFLFLVVSLLLMTGLNGIGRLIVMASILLVIWYNLKLKHTAYWGNLVVSLLGALTFILGGASYGGESATAVPGAAVPAVFAFLMHAGREIIKDIEDRAGDALVGSRTAPVRSGMVCPMIIAGVFFLILIAASLAVYLMGWFNRLYIYPLLVFIVIPLVVLYLWLVIRPQPVHFRIVSAAIKIQMALGIAAMVLGRSY